jgi:hypothetical protein
MTGRILAVDVFPTSCDHTRLRLWFCSLQIAADMPHRWDLDTQLSASVAVGYRSPWRA